MISKSITEDQCDHIFGYDYVVYGVEIVHQSQGTPWGLVDSLFNYCPICGMDLEELDEIHKD